MQPVLIGIAVYAAILHLFLAYQLGKQAVEARTLSAQEAAIGSDDQ